jgi:hypothetical protein
MRFRLLLAAVALLTPPARAADPDPKAVAAAAVKAAGGEDKLLKLFRIKERLNVSSNPEKKGYERVSVLEPPGHWWVDGADRVVEEKEPATFLVWAWTLGVFADPKTKLEALPEVTENDKPAAGVRVSGTVTPAMDVYFDKADSRLVRVDWRDSVHRFSDWKEHDGAKYPAKTVGYRTATGKPWYFSEILELERLKELPAGLKR